jgi:type IV pilus assembly protein PilA
MASSKAHSKRSLAQKGFGLVELIVVVAILGVLVVVAIPVFGAIQTNARNEVVKSELASFAKVMENQKVENGGRYPATLTKAMGFTFTPNIYGADDQDGTLRYCYNASSDQYILYATSATDNYFSVGSGWNAKQDIKAAGWPVCERVGVARTRPTQAGMLNGLPQAWVNVR